MADLLVNPDPKPLVDTFEDPLLKALGLFAYQVVSLYYPAHVNGGFLAVARGGNQMLPGV